MVTEESKQFFCWGEIVREEKVCAEDLPDTSFFVIEKIIKKCRDFLGRDILGTTFI